MKFGQPYFLGQLLIVSEAGVNSWMNYDGVTVTKRAERFFDGEVIFLVEPARISEIHKGYVDIWKALTRHGTRYFLFTSLKTSTEE